MKNSECMKMTCSLIQPSRSVSKPLKLTVNTTAHCPLAQGGCMYDSIGIRTQGPQLKLNLGCVSARSQFARLPSSRFVRWRMFLRQIELKIPPPINPNRNRINWDTSSLKIVVIGDTGVRKSCLLRFVDDSYTESYNPTTGLSVVPSPNLLQD
jgi:hypothetical protein